MIKCAQSLGKSFHYFREARFWGESWLNSVGKLGTGSQTYFHLKKTPIPLQVDGSFLLSF